MAWNAKTVKEKIYLGDNVRQVDVWGRSVTPPQEDHDQLITIGPMPTFLVGVSEPIVRWNMAFAFETTRLPASSAPRTKTICW